MVKRFRSALAGVLVASVLAIAFSSSGSAAQKPTTARTCATMNSSQTAINACETSLYLRAVRLMTADLNKVSPLFNAKEVAQAQRSWESYLRSECNVVYNFYQPGTVAPYEKAKCELELTTDRIAELKPLIHVEQGS